MSKTKFLVGLLVLLCILFVIFQFNEYEQLSCITRSLIVPMFTLLYFQSARRKSFYFSMFLILFSTTELTSLVSNYLPYTVDYYFGNGLYIAAYIFLILEVFRSLNFHYVLNNYSMHLIVLTALDVYVMYILLKVTPDISLLTMEYYVEITYNLAMLILLSVSLLNYFYKDTRKSFLLFVGSLCLVFSEVILIYYMYIETEKKNLLIFSSSFLLILGFYFLYSQSNYRIKEPNNEKEFIAQEATKYLPK